MNSRRRRQVLIPPSLAMGRSGQNSTARACDLLLEPAPARWARAGSSGAAPRRRPAGALFRAAPVSRPRQSACFCGRLNGSAVRDIFSDTHGRNPQYMRVSSLQRLLSSMSPLERTPELARARRYVRAGFLLGCLIEWRSAKRGADRPSRRSAHGRFDGILCTEQIFVLAPGDRPRLRLSCGGCCWPSRGNTCD
jgi:hypothetical protein